MDHYKHFGLEDFVWDPYFRQWVLTPTRESDAAWNLWVSQNPGLSALVHQARQIVLSLRVNEPDLTKKDIENLVKKTISKINKPITERRTEREENTVHFYQNLWVQLAASLVLLIFAGWWISDYNPLTIRIESKNPELTPQGETINMIEKGNSTNKPLKIVLEDSSRVILAPGSTVSYPSHFQKSRREIVLTGEAFFEIYKDYERPFLIYAGDVVTKVLGTSFVIKAYQTSQETIVEVKTGKVSVFTKSDPDLYWKISRRDLEGMILSPNQKVIFKQDQPRLAKMLVEKPEIILSEAEIPEFKFEKTPVSEALELISKAYGIDILYDGEALSSCPLTATLDNQTLYDKLSIICKEIDATYEVLDGQIVLHSKGCGR